MSLGFPNLNINQILIPLTINPMTEMAPLTPYPNNIPNIDSNTSLNEYKVILILIIINKNANMGNTNMELEYPIRTR